MIDSVYVVGLTGPSGAGKTEVARVLASHAFPVIDADTLARLVVEPGSPCLRELVEAFSEDILNDDGSLNRRQLAKRAFATAEDTLLLNAITHPYVIELTKKNLMKIEQMHERVAVIDAPLLFESDLDKICDMTVAVLATEEQRLQRIYSRDNLTEEQARVRMQRQKPDEYYIERAGIVLHNDKALEDLTAQAEKLARQIREWADEK